MTDTYNTLEQAQMKKLSNAAEKGDKIFLKFFAAPRDGEGLWDRGSLYREGFRDFKMKMKFKLFWEKNEIEIVYSIQC